MAEQIRNQAGVEGEGSQQKDPKKASGRDELGEKSTPQEFPGVPSQGGAESQDEDEKVEGPEADGQRLGGMAPSGGRQMAGRNSTLDDGR